ncbi:F-box/kelch-repeat protein At1g15670-like [Primulina tabacum]|uniref:F-box/kelch-repeat protein At1g15670-like n=1 Tax=Primulina tabacum TaxID=48773 RepID=UPI003F597725
METRRPLPGCRRSFFACSSDDRRFLFIAGGHDGNISAMKSIMAYDLKEDGLCCWRWKRNGMNLPEYSMEASFTLSEDTSQACKVECRFEISAETFDIASWQWNSFQENFLNGAVCPRNCIGNADGRFSVACCGNTAALQGSEWKGAAELPDNVQNL